MTFLIVCIHIPYQMFDLKIFSPTLGSSFHFPNDVCLRAKKLFDEI